MWNSLENFYINFDFADWFIGHLLWEFIFIPFLYFLWFLGKSIYIAKILLRNNRMGMGTGVKMYLADRFIRTWYQKEKGELYEEGKSYSPQPGFFYSYIYTEAIDKKLEKLGLLSL